MNSREEGIVWGKGKGDKATDWMMKKGEITRLGMIVELKCKGKRGKRNGKRGEWDGGKKS